MMKMINTQLTSDKVAMSLSILCVIHCLFVPSFLILTSGIMALSVDNEFFHKLIVLLAVPISIFALSLGYKNHKTHSFLLLGLMGLVILITAVAIGSEILGESLEKILTVIGSSLVIYVHYMNYKICKETDCKCHN